eukprot:366000-Chlamydomonas_euryale.AAC.49
MGHEGRLFLFSGQPLGHPRSTALVSAVHRVGRAAGSGQRAAGSGQRAAGSGQRAAGTRQWAAGTRQRTVRSGRNQSTGCSATVHRPMFDKNPPAGLAVRVEAQNR